MINLFSHFNGTHHFYDIMKSNHFRVEHIFYHNISQLRSTQKSLRTNIKAAAIFIACSKL